MKLGLISMFAIYLVIKAFFNILMMVLFNMKKVTADTILTLTAVENLISLFFTVMIIRLAIKSGGKA